MAAHASASQLAEPLPCPGGHRKSATALPSPESTASRALLPDITDGSPRSSDEGRGIRKSRHSVAPLAHTDQNSGGGLKAFFAGDTVKNLATSAFGMRWKRPVLSDEHASSGASEPSTGTTPRSSMCSSAVRLASGVNDSMVVFRREESQLGSVSRRNVTSDVRLANGVSAVTSGR